MTVWKFYLNPAPNLFGTLSFPGAPLSSSPGNALEPSQCGGSAFGAFGQVQVGSETLQFRAFLAVQS